MRIPVFLYVDDLDEYIADRGKLTWNMDEIPFDMAKNNKELENNIYEFKEEKYLDKLENTFKNMGLLEDGKASKRVVRLIEEYVKG